MTTRCVSFALLALLVPVVVSAQRLPRAVVPTHYDITLTPDLAKATFSGEEVIEVEVPRETATIVVNAAEIAFGPVFATSGRADSQGGARHQATVTADAEKEMATLTFAPPLPTGTARLHIAFTGTLNDKLRGFYLSKGEQRNYAATQFEATDARRAFPCFDEPDLKATFTLAFVVDAGDTVLANTSQVSDQPGPEAGKHTVRFAPTAKMSTYLVAFAVGDWRCVEGEQDGIPLRVCGTPDKAPLGAYALGWAKKVVRFYNDYFGIKYPFGKLDSLGLPDFSAGAMENAGLITWRESILFVDEKTASDDQKRGVAETMAHEVGHMWFGDLVTMKWWDDIWLNEGFASWVTPKPVAAAMPEWNIALEEVEGTSEALATDALLNTRAIRAQGSEAETPEQIALLFDGIAYGKTASVLRMVEAYVGEEPFRKGVQAYLRKFSYGNATAEDFWTTLARESGKPVDAIMSSFVKNAGAPLLDVATTCEGADTRVAVSQQRFVIDPARMKAGSPETWTVPVCMSRPNAPGVTCELLTARQQVFTIPGCSPWVLGNTASRGHYRVAYPSGDLEEITKAVPRLGAPDQIALERDQWALVRAGRADIGEFLDIAHGLLQTDVPEVLRSVEGHLSYVDRYLATDANRDAFRAWVRTQYEPRLRQLGWEPKPGESIDRKGLRAALLQLPGTEHDPGVMAEARRLAERTLADYGSVDPSVRDVAVSLAAASGDAALYGRYRQKLAQAKTPAEYYLYLYSLALFPTPDLQRQTLAFALGPDVRAQDMGGLLATMVVSRASQPLALQYVVDNWDTVRAKTPEGLYAAESMLAGVAGSLCTAEQREVVVRFFEQHPLKSNDRPLRRALESIDACIDLKAREQAPFDTWVRKHGTQ